MAYCMKGTGKILRLFSPMLLFLFLASCSKNIDTNGHTVELVEYTSFQTLEFRIMLEWPGEYDIGIPQSLVEKGVSLRLTHCEDEDYYSPDLEDPIIKESHAKLIRALGERYDGHPDLGSVDIGSVGPWGEWHEYCHPELIPSREERSAIIDLYYESFPNTPLIALVDDREGIQYTVSKGRSAWRGDCWGDYLPEGSGWNHHEDSYWPAHNLIPEAWKNGL